MRSALIVIFNSDYSTNIPKLETIYRDRFTHLLYIVPDHYSGLDRYYYSEIISQRTAFLLDKAYNQCRRIAGKRNAHELYPCSDELKDRICRVYGHQFYFYDFITQATDKLLKLDVDWYWFAGDDAILNPRLNESSIEEWFDISESTDCVLCRPVIGSDRWINRIEGSISAAEKKLKYIMKGKFPLQNDFSIAAEPGALDNLDIPVSCSDFFGIRNDRLGDILQIWKRCFHQKLYVEIAVPNALLRICTSPHFVHHFLWERTLKAEDWQKMAVSLINSPNIAFAHPLKLSQMHEAELSELYTPRISKAVF